MSGLITAHMFNLLMQTILLIIVLGVEVLLASFVPKLKYKDGKKELKDDWKRNVKLVHLSMVLVVILYVLSTLLYILK